MLELTVGTILGFVIGAAVALATAKVLGREHPLVAKIFGAEPDGEMKLVPCPDVSTGFAAVPPGDLPEVITAEEVRTDPTVLRRVKHAHTRALVEAIAQWRPRRHRSEAKFQESFESFLGEHGPRHSREFDPDRLRRHPTVPFAAGRVAKPDFIYHDEVLVELKRGLTASGETDRALGQLLRYLYLWWTKGTAVLVICGEYDVQLKALAQNYVRGWRKQGLPVMALFVRDTGEDATEEVPEVEAPVPAVCWPARKRCSHARRLDRRLEQRQNSRDLALARENGEL